jgi:hypothetical protein
MYVNHFKTLHANSYTLDNRLIPDVSQLTKIHGILFFACQACYALAHKLHWYTNALVISLFHVSIGGFIPVLNIMASHSAYWTSECC